MLMPKEPLRFLSADDMDAIHRNALRILAEIGMKIDHDEALAKLKAAGCKVDEAARHVFFPKQIVQRYVDKMKADYAKREWPERMSVRYSHVRFKKEPFRIHDDFTVNAGGYCVFIYDLNGTRRTATLKDTREALKLVAQLEGVTNTGLPVAAQDVPLPIRPVMMAAELVKATDKLGGIETLTPFDIEYTTRIGEVVRGSREELRKRPILVGYAEAKTPLMLDNNMCEVFLTYLRNGMPQSLDTMPNCGATAPMHPAAALTLGIAETLGGMVLAYSVDENAVVTIDVTPSFSDMGTGIFKYASAERASLLGARIQMISAFYGCPSGVHGGKTDSLVPDVRCGVEKGISMLMPVLCGAVGFGTVGHIENAVTFSPAQLVMDSEIAGYVRRVIRGFDATDETINFDLIKSVGIGGNYLSEMDTAEKFREFVNLSPFFKVEPWGANTRLNEGKNWVKLAEEKARELLKNDVPSPLSSTQIKDIDKLLKEAAAKLKKQGLM